MSMFLDKESLQELLSFVNDFGESILEMRVICEEVLEYLLAVIIFSGSDELCGKALC